MPIFSYKIFNHGGDTLLAIADAAIVGKTLAGGGVEITVSEEFYSGDACGEREALELLKKATIVNAIGKDTIKLLAGAGLIDEKQVLLIGGVPHAQIIAIR